MKIVLFLTLLMLLASTNVFGETGERLNENKRPSDRTETDRISTDSDHHNTADFKPTKPITNASNDTQTIKPTNETLIADQSTSRVDESKPISGTPEEKKPVEVTRSAKPNETDQVKSTRDGDSSRRAGEGFDRRPTDRNSSKPTGEGFDRQPTDRDSSRRTREGIDRRPKDGDSSRRTGEGFDHQSTDRDSSKPIGEGFDRQPTDRDSSRQTGEGFDRRPIDRDSSRRTGEGFDRQPTDRNSSKPTGEGFDRQPIDRDSSRRTGEGFDRQPTDGDSSRRTREGIDRRPTDRDSSKPVGEGFNRQPTDRDSSRRTGEGFDRRPTDRDSSKPVGEGFDRQPTDRDSSKPAGEGFDRQPTDRDSSRRTGEGFDRRPTDRDSSRPSSEDFDHRPVDHDETHEQTRTGDDKFNRDNKKHPTSGPLTFDEDEHKKSPSMIPVGQGARLSEKNVHVSGNIILVRYRPSVIGSVQYDLDGARFVNGAGPSTQTQQGFAQDFIERESQVTLYVSTSKRTDRKLAFAQFEIKNKQDHFPLSFDIDVELPSQQRGLLERADITLYFFVYVTNPQSRIDTYIPAGNSQILLQGTNRLVQKLDVYVRASGIEVSGIFRSRFGERTIRPGTSFQVLIVPEKSLKDRQNSSVASVAQLTINNLPSMFPVPFSLLVHHQMLKSNTKYYAIAYVVENGVRRFINQEPVWVINEQKVLVTPQVIFFVIPSPFILSGTVTRSMPGSFVLQPRSSLILRFHQIGSNTSDIIYKLPEILSLPQVFDVNISQASRFDPSKNYDIRALIIDEKNNIYMANLRPIPLVDEFSKLNVPVDDLLYYVQARLQSSSNKPINYIPGSTAQIFVTESPETPTKPIVSMHIASIPKDFREFSIQVPATAIQRNKNYYLVMMIETNGFITHVSKSLLISNNQTPPLFIQLPILSLNLINGVLFDVDGRPAQWSSSSYANLYLLDDKAEDPNKAIVQVWKIHLENDFPVRFEVQVDFSLLRSDHVYRLQGAIENGPNLLEYKPAGSVLALNPNGGFINDVRIPVHNVKTNQIVRGLVYINDIQETLPKDSKVIVQLSSSPSIEHPSIIDEITLNGGGRRLPLNFTMNLPLNKIDINSVYYFLVRYIVRDNVIIPSSQAFAFSPRNEATVVLTLAKTPQIPLTGQVTATGSPFQLPSGSTLHLYITDNSDRNKPLIFSEVYLQASPNTLYEFTMNIDSTILQKRTPLYLRADILYNNKVILSIPRPALLQITPGGQWNINLIVDLPTLLVGQIVSLSQFNPTSGDLDVYIDIFEAGINKVVDTQRLRIDANFPQKFRVEIDNNLFARYPNLKARAVVKNCKGSVLFESGGSVDIEPGLNLKLILPVVLTDQQKFDELRPRVNDTASLYAGSWRLSVTGVVTDNKNDAVTSSDNNFALQ